MRYEQIRSVLQELAPTYHRKVSEYFQELAEGDVSPRVQLMLDYLIDHEEHRALALSEFCHEASPHLLDQWVKGVEINFPLADKEILDARARNDLDILVKAAVNYKQALVNYFNHLLERSTDKKVVDMFQSLMKQEERAMKRMIRHSQGLSDL